MESLQYFLLTNSKDSSVCMRVLDAIFVVLGVRAPAARWLALSEVLKRFFWSPTSRVVPHRKKKTVSADVALAVQG